MSLRDLMLPSAAVVLAVVLLRAFPGRTEVVLGTSLRFFVEMLLILPAVMVLVGLFGGWVPKEVVARYLGRASGLRGLLLSFLMGALPTGPLYMAFPMASALLAKGARVANVVAFLSAWACIKVPQEMVELQFLGPKFMASRLVLTVASVVGMGILVEKLLRRKYGGVRPEGDGGVSLRAEG